MVARVLIMCLVVGFTCSQADGANAAAITFMQDGCCGIPRGFNAKVGFRLPESTGDLNVVVIGWSDSTTTLAATAVTDDLGYFVSFSDKCLLERLGTSNQAPARLCLPDF